ncbi:pyrroline-5-carboxylate reductase [Aliiruegeria sabulilitoris]|uniref:pyrroline-5-carboxylate reductase n=1 Tax=Aliiruegeria sabulilitoris TaxID=1510458 RepID=UPI00082C8C43|nr:pyrroline-5-carboxylate reductase [Aliiruegeria sabulilitoris]NDR55411.1 pyrroline-5-carboxylate reductase [Pseudoruegeria sp. M32A2M]
MRLGFIGTGAITEAIVTGLLRTEAEVGEILLSERNRTVSARLEAASARVRVCADNQQIAETSDLLFLAVRPQDAHAVLEPLRLREGQHVCSLIATIPSETLQGWFRTPVRIFRAIPLPAVAELRGVTALFPNDPVGEALFGPLGTVVAARSLDEFDAYATASALMGTYFGILETATDWMCETGIERDTAQAYLTPVFLGLARTAAEAPERSFSTLRDEHSTPGGLNEQVFSTFAANGGTEALTKALNAAGARVRNART